MKKFILNLISFLLILFLIDRGIFHLFQAHRPSDYKLFLESKQAFFDDTHDVDILVK